MTSPSTEGKRFGVCHTFKEKPKHLGRKFDPTECDYCGLIKGTCDMRTCCNYCSHTATPSQPVGGNEAPISSKGCEKHGVHLCYGCLLAEKAVVQEELEKIKKAIIEAHPDGKLFERGELLGAFDFVEAVIWLGKEWGASTMHQCEPQEINFIDHSDSWELYKRVMDENKALTTSNNGLVEALERIAGDWPNNEDCLHPDHAKQALEQFGGGS